MVEEEIEVTEIVLVAEFEDVCRIVKQPRVVTEDCEETIMVPVVKEVPVTRVVEEWTGRSVTPTRIFLYPPITSIFVSLPMM